MTSSEFVSRCHHTPVEIGFTMHVQCESLSFRIQVKQNILLRMHSYRSIWSNTVQVGRISGLYEFCKPPIRSINSLLSIYSLVRAISDDFYAAFTVPSIRNKNSSLVIRHGYLLVSHCHCLSCLVKSIIWFLDSYCQ